MSLETHEENRMGTAKMFPLILSMSLPAMFSMLIQALRIICLCFPLATLGLVSSNMYPAIGRGNYSLVMSLMRQLVVLVPVAWLLAKVTNDVGMVWWAFPIAEAVSLAVSMIFFTHLYKTELKK